MVRYTPEECAAAARQVSLPEAAELRDVVAELAKVEDRRGDLLDRRAELARQLFAKDVSRPALAGLMGLTPRGVDAVRNRL